MANTGCNTLPVGQSSSQATASVHHYKVITALVRRLRRLWLLPYVHVHEPSRIALGSLYLKQLTHNAQTRATLGLVAPPSSGLPQSFQDGLMKRKLQSIASSSA